MEIQRVPRIMQDTAKTHNMRGRSIGLVPTMGALHDGHMSLIRSSRQENDITIVTIFVNPLQFGAGEDFEKYPRDTDRDIMKLREANVEILFIPEPGAIYPEGFETGISVPKISERLCGRFRPGHFTAVATVVAKLINITMPKRAYFGQKDFQQCLVIRRMAADLNLPIEIVTSPTQREPDGLAMSSRNQYLSDDERRAAGVIPKALKAASDAIKSGRSVNDAVAGMNALLHSEPLIGEIQYAGAYDPKSLEDVTEHNGQTLLALALKIGDTRLIDNMLV